MQALPSVHAGQMIIPWQLAAMTRTLRQTVSSVSPANFVYERGCSWALHSIKSVLHAALSTGIGLKTQCMQLFHRCWSKWRLSMGVLFAVCPELASSNLTCKLCMPAVHANDQCLTVFCQLGTWSCMMLQVSYL